LWGDPESRKWTNKEKTVDKNITFSRNLEKFAALVGNLQRIQYKIRSSRSQKVRYLLLIGVESNKVVESNNIVESKDTMVTVYSR